MIGRFLKVEAKSWVGSIQFDCAGGHVIERVVCHMKIGWRDAIHVQVLGNIGCV